MEEMRTDAVIAAVHDQVAAGLDVITDGEQTRYDFNLSFYGRLDGLEPTAGPQSAGSVRPPTINAENTESPEDCGPRADWEQLRSSCFCSRSHRRGPFLKASVPGPYTLSGRINPGGIYKRPLGRDRGLDSDRAGRTETIGAMRLSRNHPR